MLAEHARDVAERLRSTRWLLDQLDQHDLAGPRAAQVVARHEHAMADARIVGHDEADAGLVVQAADDLARVALENFDERAFAAGRDGPVPLTRTATRSPCIVSSICRGGEEHGRGAIVRQQEAVAVAMPADGADDERQSARAGNIRRGGCE